MPATPTFAAVVGVKDEVDLIGACIGHLRRLGVDAIRVLDAGSTDGTLEAIESLHAGPDLALTHHSDLDPDPLAWAATAARLGRESGADWVMFLDADEFWIPAGGTMRSIGGLEALDVVIVDRFNVPLDRDGVLTADRGLPSPDRDMELIVRSIPNFRAHLDRNPETPWIRIVPAGKVLARAERIGRITDGFHRIEPTPGPPLRQGRIADLLVAHVPYTTLERFARKIDNIRKVFSVHDEYCGDNIAWHWRRLLALRDDDAIRAEFMRQAFDEQTLAELRADGTIEHASAWLSRDRRPA